MSRERKVLLEVTVVPEEGNESDFWEPNDTLVVWGIAEKVLGKDCGGWKVHQIVTVEETKGFTN